MTTCPSWHYLPGPYQDDPGRTECPNLATHKAQRTERDDAFAALRPETIVVSDDQFDALTAMLDADPAPTPRLAALLSRPTVFQSGVERPVTYSGTY